MDSRPHFLLFCDGHNPKLATEAATSGTAASSRGHWRFILENLEAGTRVEVSDAELMFAPERAALLAVVRGLEALDQPSRVTLVTTSRYVARGLQFGLSEWRESDYCWEHFGSVQPIRNADLWRRIDHAMQFHQINCRWIAGETAEEGATATRLEAEPLQESRAEVGRPSVQAAAGPKVARKRPRQPAPVASASSSGVWMGKIRHFGSKLREFCQPEVKPAQSWGWFSSEGRSLGV